MYADYVKIDVPLNSLAMAKAPPAPIPAEPEATRSPTATPSIVDEIAQVAKGQHGTLPQPGESGQISAGGEVEVTVINDTPHVLTLLIGSPSSIKVQIEACGSCQEYNLAGPAFCPEEGRPRKTIRLKAGTSQVVARVSDPGVTPFYGTWELKPDTSYFNCFFIVRR